MEGLEERLRRLRDAVMEAQQHVDTARAAAQEMSVLFNDSRQLLDDALRELQEIRGQIRATEPE